MIDLEVDTRRSVIRPDPDVPARYLVLGDFGARPANPIAIDRDNFSQVLARLDVTLGAGRIRDLDDFHPDQLFQRLGVFDHLRAAQQPPPPSKLRSAPRANLEEILRPSSLLERMTGGGDAFDKYLRELTEAHVAPAPASDPGRTTQLCELMRAVLHHPRVQALESAWRGLDFAVRRIDDQSTQIYIAQFSDRELAADLLHSEDLRSTRAYAMLHAHEWRAVIGLYSFGGESSHIELLGRLALLAASAGAPFIAEGSVDMGPYWEQLRSIPEAGYLGLALPRFLLRLPYGSRASSIESFDFEELQDSPQHSAYLWGNPALACLVLTAGEGLDLHGLPLHTYREDGEWIAKPCAELLITESQALALIDLGLMPLVGFRDTDRVHLAGFQAINGKPLSLAT